MKIKLEKTVLSCKQAKKYELIFLNHLFFIVLMKVKVKVWERS